MVEPVSDNILNLVNELYNNLDAKDKIINEQALEIARLNKRNQEIYDGFKVTIDEVCETDREKREYKERIDKAIEHCKSNMFVDSQFIYEQLEILEAKNE